MTLAEIFCGQCPDSHVKDPKYDNFDPIVQKLRGDTPEIIFDLIEDCIRLNPDRRPICFQVIIYFSCITLYLLI